MEKGEARLELAKECTGAFFKLNHSAAALANFLRKKQMDPRSIKGYSSLSPDERKHLWRPDKFIAARRRRTKKKA